jgi:flagellar biosynthesis chaperone FliJ
MGHRQAPFRYALQPLLTKQSWDVDALSLELTAARLALQEQERQLDRFRSTLRELNASLVALREGGAMLDLARQQRLVDYRASQEEAMHQQEEHVESARRIGEQITQQLTAARQAVEGFENHREGHRQIHAREAANAAAKDLDDDWLALQRWREVHS